MAVALITFVQLLTVPSSDARETEIFMSRQKVMLMKIWVPGGLIDQLRATGCTFEAVSYTNDGVVRFTGCSDYGNEVIAETLIEQMMDEMEAIPQPIG